MSDKPEPDVQTHFQHVDRDGDGRIDLDEFRTMLRELGMSRGNDVIEHAFKAIDINDNGHIDLEEFSQWWARHSHPGTEDQGFTASDSPDP